MKCDFKTLASSLLALFLMVDSSVSFAQTTEGTPSLGQIAGAPKDGPGTVYIKNTYESWEERCIRTDDGKDPCQLYQLLMGPEGNAIAEFALYRLPAGGQAVAAANIVVPIETLLTASLRLHIEGSLEKVYPYAFCTQAGCVARVGFTAEEVEKMKKGSQAELTIVPAAAPDQPITILVSLKGFTAGYKEIVKSAIPQP